MNTNSKIVLGVAGAAVAGALIGLMVAPDKGSNLRNKVSNNARDLINGLTDWLLSKGKEVVESTKDKLQPNTTEDMPDEDGSEWKKSKKTSLI